MKPFPPAGKIPIKSLKAYSKLEFFSIKISSTVRSSYSNIRSIVNEIDAAKIIGSSRQIKADKKLFKSPSKELSLDLKAYEELNKIPGSEDAVKSLSQARRS